MNTFKTLGCKAYSWLEKHWFAKIMYPGAPLVKLMDWTIGSECKYCMAFRAVMIGFGLGFCLGFGLGIGGVFGVVLVIAALLLALFERTCKE